MKKKQVPVCLGLDVLTIGVLSLNKYLLNMPEVVCLATGIITVIAAVWTAVTVSCSPIWKVLLPVLAVIVLAVSILGSYCNPYWNSLQSRFVTDAGTRSWDDSIEEDEARAELKYLMK